jgi:uncharacterized protein YqgQ
MENILDKMLKSLSKEEIEMMKLKTQTKFENGEITKEKYDKMMSVLNKHQTKKSNKTNKKKNKKTNKKKNTRRV